MKPTSVLGLLSLMLVGTADVLAASAAIGVDLGTEFIKASLVKPRVPLEIVLTKDSRRKEAASIAFKPVQGDIQSGAFPERLYGSDAVALAARFPGEVYPNLKTLLGQPLDGDVAREYTKRHPALQAQADAERGTVAFRSKAFVDGEGDWSVEELLAMQLQSVRQNAQALAGSDSPIKAAVITVPPYFTIEEKRAVRTAAELAGLEVLDLISDGLAVGLNYATSRQFPSATAGEKPEYHLVFDMGAGSTKSTVLRFQSRSVKDVGKTNKTVQEVQVVGYGWDRSLGGDALNALIIDDMATKFVESPKAKALEATTDQVLSHGRAVARLSKEAQRLRHVLSANANTQGSFEGLYEDVDFKYKITRAEFEELAAAHAERVGTSVRDALSKANLDVSDLTSVILHGGASRTPFVQRELEKVIGSADKIRNAVNSDESAVMGAVFRGAELSPSFRVKEIRLSDTAVYPVGLKYTDAKGEAVQQRVWSAASVLGGPAKNVTLDVSDNVAATFFQTVDGKDIDVSALTTVNLTESLTKAKENFKCTDDDLTVRLAASLSSADGSVVVSSLYAGCEVEISEGLIDGVKNLFGFGKKDKTTDDASDGSSSKSSTATDSSSSAAAEASDVPAVKIREFAGIPVGFKLVEKGVATPSKSSFQTSRKRLSAFTASDTSRRQREEALNQLEAFTYKARELPETSGWEKHATEAERQTTLEKASEYGDWIYGDGMEATKQEFEAKLKDLQSVVDRVNARVEDHEQRPLIISSLQEKLEQSTQYVADLRREIGEYDEWHAKAKKEVEEAALEADDFADLEDDDDDSTGKKPTMEDILKERGPVPPVHVIEDLEPLEKMIESAKTWLKTSLPKVSDVPATSDAAVVASEFKEWVTKLEKEGLDLALKGASNFEKRQRKEKAEQDKLEKAKKSAEKARKKAEKARKKAEKEREQAADEGHDEL